MSQDITRDLTNEQPFEVQVLSRLDRISNILQSLDSRVHNLEARVENIETRLEKVETRLDDVDVRLQKLEARAYDTKPIWEQALKEIVYTRREMSKRLDRIEGMAFDTRGRLGDVEDRLDRLESRPTS